MEKSKLADKLKQLLDNMSQEGFDKSWAEVEKLGLVGPTVEEYLGRKGRELYKEQNKK